MGLGGSWLSKWPPDDRSQEDWARPGPTRPAPPPRPNPALDNYVKSGETPRHKVPPAPPNWSLMEPGTMDDDHFGRNLVLVLLAMGIVMAVFMWLALPGARAEYQEMYRLRWQDVGADRCYYRDADPSRLSCVRREP